MLKKVSPKRKLNTVGFFSIIMFLSLVLLGITYVGYKIRMFSNQNNFIKEINSLIRVSKEQTSSNNEVYVFNNSKGNLNYVGNNYTGILVMKDNKSKVINLTNGKYCANGEESKFKVSKKCHNNVYYDKLVIENDKIVSNNISLASKEELKTVNNNIPKLVPKGNNIIYDTKIYNGKPFLAITVNIPNDVNCDKCELSFTLQNVNLSETDCQVNYYDTTESKEDSNEYKIDKENTTITYEFSANSNSKLMFVIELTGNIDDDVIIKNIMVDNFNKY